MPEGKSKGRKVLFGCGIGCGTLLLLAVGSCVGFSVWIDRPGELLEPRRLLGPATTGYLEWTLAEDDPGTQAFVQELLDRSETQTEHGTANMPRIFQRFIARNQAREREQLREMLPIVAVWTMHPGEREDDEHLLSLSIERMGNRMSFMDWTLGWIVRFTPGIEDVHHDNERIYAIEEGDEGFTFFIHDQNLFVTTDLEGARRALDRMREPANPAITSELGDAFATLPDAAMVGAVSNEAGALAGLWEMVAGTDDDMDPREEEIPRAPPEWDAIRLATLRGGLSGPRSFEGVLELHCRDAQWAAENGESFVAALRAGYRRAHLPIDSEITTEGDRIRVLLRIDDLTALLDELD